MRIERRGTVSPTASYVRLDDTEFLFSYDSIVAFRIDGHNWVATENIWGTATGKHLNYVSTADGRIPRAEFLEALEKASARIDENARRASS